MLFSPSYVVALCCVACGVLILFRRHKSSPPGGSVPGMPLLGNVVALGRGGASFLRSCRRQYGPDHFTLNLAGQRMTFVFHPRLIDSFFKAPDEDITFRPAVEQFTQRVFGLPSREFFPLHAGILASLRHLLVPGELPALSQQLADRVQGHMPASLPVGQTVDLYAAVKHLVFRSSVELLFGEPFYAAASVGPGGSLEDHFFAFEAGFEMAASPIPHILQPTFTRSRAALVERLGHSLTAGHMQGTVAAELLARSGLRLALAPNMLLAILWASQANTVPATFWTLAFLLLPHNAAHRRRVVEDLEQAEAADLAAGPGSDGPQPPAGSAAAATASSAAAAYRLASDRRSLVSRCVAEATRLRVQSIDVRIAARDLSLVGDAQAPPLRLPKGRVIAICPYVSHHDDGAGHGQMYGADAAVFDPDRAALQVEDGKAVMTSIAGLAFGGGVYRCPGRYFAEMEVALVVQLVLRHHASLALAAGGHVGSNGGGNGAFPPPPRDGPSSSTCGNGEGEEQGGPRGPAAWLARLVSACGGANAEFGLWVTGGAGDGGCGAGTGGETAGGTAGRTGMSEDWAHSGDPERRLPACDLQRLVGIKVPVGPCWVTAGP